MNNNKVSTGDPSKSIEVIDNGESRMKFYTEIYKAEYKRKCEIFVYRQLSNLSYSPAAESVFLIDHILEFILLGLDRASLLKCRLLSSRWTHFCTKPLQKIVTIFFFQTERNHPPVRAEDLIVMRSYNGRSVKDLIPVMDKSLEFPSTSFAFFNVYSYYNFDNFFNSCGHFITKFQYDGVITLDDVRHLLLTQAPHLEQLLLLRIFTPMPEPETPTGAYRNIEADKLIQNPGFAHESTSTTTQKLVLKNLKIFKCNHHIPEVFVQQLLESCPCLVEVQLPQKYLHNLVQPTDRVTLLKELEFIFGQPSFYSLDVVLNHHPDRLPLRRIVFSSPFRYDEPTTNLHLRSMEFMKQLLRASAATCQILEWIGFVKHFEIPRMPQVTHLNFEIGLTNGRIVTVFEKGVILGDTFPNLKILEVRAGTYKSPLVPVGVFFGMHNEIMAPVTSVRHVLLSNFHGPDEYVRDFGQIFPNAIVHGYLITMLPVGNRVSSVN